MAFWNKYRVKTGPHCCGRKLCIIRRCGAKPRCGALLAERALTNIDNVITDFLTSRRHETRDALNPASQHTKMEALSGGLEKLRLSLDAANDDRGCIDSIAGEQRPPKRQRKTKEDIKKELEHEFLTPSRSFNTQWLNQLQQRWETPTNYRGLFQIAPTQTRTIIRFTREGLEGRVTGYKEVTVPANSATAKTRHRS